MADNSQPPARDPAGFSSAYGLPGSRLSRATITAVLLVVGGAILGLIGGAIWAAVTPRVVYQVYTLHPPTAFAINAETSGFIAADGIFTFISLGGGVVLGLAGYLAGVRRYGPAPMAGLIAGGVAAAFVMKWLGTLLTGGNTFDTKLATSKPGALLRAPITLGSHGALAFWAVATGLAAGIPELVSFLRMRRLAVASGPVPGGSFGGLPGGTWPQPSGGWPSPGWPQQQPPPAARPASSAQPWLDGQPDTPPGRYGPDPTGQSADLDQ